VIEEEMLIYWEVTVSVDVREKFIETCFKFRVVTEIQQFESQGPKSVRFLFFGGWLKGAVYKRRVNKRDEFYARILNATVRKKRREI
jgi:hypothetical protein